uniref:ApaG domain-containing protein n=1 Tax=Ditylum brightwellii TaxID=49249 RepID=A0A7S1ZQQ2_9STRA|mmetsp:Transcript_36969/g.55267  ORF Transcript_36969/g.55267 Transcript_36969/m.55267 type:complete len:457 (+) Transcript_36969:160-1530(+)
MRTFMTRSFHRLQAGQYVRKDAGKAFFSSKKNSALPFGIAPTIQLQLRDNVSEQELQKFRKSSIRVYRILLRHLKGCDGKERVLLQSPLNPRDYGRAKLVRSNDYTHSSRNDENNNDAEKNKERLRCIQSQLFNMWHSNNSDEQYNNTMHLLNKVLYPPSNTASLANDPADNNYDNDNYDDYEYAEEEQDTSLLLTRQELYHAIRASFSRLQLLPYSFPHSSDGNVGTISKAELSQLLSFAIHCNSLLVDIESTTQRTTITEDARHGVRVIATSRCIGTARSTPTASSKTAAVLHHLTPKPNISIKHRFAYRIRIENIGREKDNKNTTDDDDDDDLEAVQLLGRTWKIVEHESNNENEESDGVDLKEKEVVTVDAPTGGAVGHLPVLKPGQIFEYMSGCELTTPTGTMGGSFYMSRVSTQTKSCTIGDPMDMNMEHQFLMNVEPFALIADGGDLSN